MKTLSNLRSAKATVFAIAATVLGSLSVTAQVVTYTAGDLLVGFRASGGTGASTTFVYNIGSSTGFRDNGNQGSLVNLSSQLAATYGSDWYTRSDLSFGVVGVRDNTDPSFASAVNGDPSATIYVSRATSGFGSSTAWGSPTAFTKSQVVLASTQIISFTHSGSQVAGTFAYQTAASGTGGFGAYVDTSATNDWAFYTSQSADFGYFTGGIENTFGGGGALTSVDVYRILATTTGASPTGVRGLGSYETTISIDSSGQVFAGTAAAVPEPSTYAALFGAAALGLAAYRRRQLKHQS